VQRATADQQRAQASAALAMLEELKAQPRPEALEVARAQVENARANLKNAQDHSSKLQAGYDERQVVTRDDLDNAVNATNAAATNLLVAQRQYDLVKAGAWSYDVKNQEMQYQALAKASAAADALLAKYTLRAPSDGVVLSIQTAVGSYVSSQGAYGTYTQGFSPLVVMGMSQDFLEVRCYIDEILVTRLPAPERMTAKMFIRGTDLTLPLTFERMQPYISPKIELADERQERVDVRVLPIIFRFGKPKDLNLFPGQLVDVYIGQK
jgi:HlyD family secretion protein